MSVQNKRGVLVVSLDLPETVDQSLALSAGIKPLVQLFDKHQISATWACADPAASSALSHLVLSRGGHEIAILAGRAGEGGRLQARQQLMQQLTRAKAKGVVVATAAFTRSASADLLQAASQQGIYAVRNGAGEFAPTGGGWLASLTARRGSSLKLLAPRTIGFGLVDVPATLRLGAVGRGEVALVQNALAQVAAWGGVLHVALDVEALLSALKANLRGLAQILARAAVQRANARLAIGTLSAAAAAVNCASPARSILRRAA